MYKVFCVIAALALFSPIWVLAQASASPAQDGTASSAGGAPVQRGARGVDGPAFVTLASMLEISRPLLVFSPTDVDERFLRQVLLFAAGARDAHERQVVFVPVVGRRDAKSWGAGFDAGGLGPGETAAVRGQFDVSAPEFAVVLVGKDGGEKYRSHVPVTIEKLDALIDAMPMRQQEMRDGGHRD